MAAYERLVPAAAGASSIVPSMMVAPSPSSKSADAIGAGAGGTDDIGTGGAGAIGTDAAGTDVRLWKEVGAAIGVAGAGLGTADDASRAPHPSQNRIVASTGCPHTGHFSGMDAAGEAADSAAVRATSATPAETGRGAPHS